MNKNKTQNRTFIVSMVGDARPCTGKILLHAVAINLGMARSPGFWICNYPSDRKFWGKNEIAFEAIRKIRYKLIQECANVYVSLRQNYRVSHCIQAVWSDGSSTICDI